MKDNMNPKRMTRSLKSGGAMPTPAKNKSWMVGRMIAYKKGGSAQPDYKSGEMHKCMPN
jgi:hypothetical protein